MSVIETMTFRLRVGADEEAFLAVDTRLQSDFAYQQPGLVRRTIARGRGDRAQEWIVVDVWWSAENADACAHRWEHDALAQEFMAFLDPTTVDVRRYEDLPG